MFVEEFALVSRRCVDLTVGSFDDCDRADVVTVTFEGELVEDAGEDKYFLLSRNVVSAFVAMGYIFAVLELNRAEWCWCLWVCVHGVSLISCINAAFLKLLT